MGIGANVFLAGLVGIGYYVYATIDPTRSDYPSPVSELFARVSALPAIPYGVKTMWVVPMNQFGVKTSSETDKTVTWTFTYKGQIFGTYTVNFLPNGEKSTTVFCTLEEFEPEIENSLMADRDWDILRAIARDVTYEQVYAALNKGAPSVEKIRQHQGRILANLGTINKLKKMNEGDVGAKMQELQGRVNDSAAEAEASAAASGAGDDSGPAE